MKDTKLLDRLRTENFDLGITEMISYCGYAIFKVIGLKNYASAFATNLVEAYSDPLGVSSNPSYIPGLFMITILLEIKLCK